MTAKIKSQQERKERILCEANAEDNTLNNKAGELTIPAMIQIHLSKIGQRGAPHGNARYFDKHMEVVNSLSMSSDERLCGANVTYASFY